VIGIDSNWSELLKTVGLLAVRPIGKTTIKKQKKKKYYRWTTMEKPEKNVEFY